MWNFSECRTSFVFSVIWLQLICSQIFGLSLLSTLTIRAKVTTISNCHGNYLFHLLASHLRLLSNGIVYQILWKIYMNFEFLNKSLNSFWLRNMTDFYGIGTCSIFPLTILWTTFFLFYGFYFSTSFYVYEDPLGKKSLDFHRLSSKANVFLQFFIVCSPLKINSFIHSA